MLDETQWTALAIGYSLIVLSDWAVNKKDLSDKAKVISLVCGIIVWFLAGCIMLGIEWIVTGAEL